MPSEGENRKLWKTWKNEVVTVIQSKPRAGRGIEQILKSTGASTGPPLISKFRK